MNESMTPSPERVRELLAKYQLALALADDTGAMGATVLYRETRDTAAILAAWLRVGEQEAADELAGPCSETKPCDLPNWQCTAPKCVYGLAKKRAAKLSPTQSAQAPASYTGCGGTAIKRSEAGEQKLVGEPCEGCADCAPTPSAQASEQPTMTSEQIEALRYLITDSDRWVDSMVNSLRDPDYGVALLKREQFLNDVRAEIAERQKHGDALRHFLVQQSATPPVSAQANDEQRPLTADERDAIRRAYQKSVTRVDAPTCKRCGGPMLLLDGEWECHNMAPASAPPSAQACEPTALTNLCPTCGHLGVTPEGWCVDCDWRTNGVKVAFAYRERPAIVSAQAREPVYTQDMLDAAKWRAHELIRGLNIDPPEPPCEVCVSAQAREALEAVEQLLRDYRDVPDVSDAEGQAVMERAVRGIAILRSLSVGGVEGAVDLQSRVHEWILACFGAAIGADKRERSHRFIEEALELVQAAGCSREEVLMLVDYTYGRPVGELEQEIGGVLVTLAALCSAHGIDMEKAGDTEIARCWTKVDQIRAKQAGKPRGSPLPAAPGADSAPVSA